MVYERRPNNHAHIFSVTLLFMALGGIGFFGLISALDTGDPRWLALLLTAVFGIVVAGWRVLQHDARAFSEHERLAPKPFIQPDEGKKDIRVYTHLSSGGGKINVGRFLLSQAQWHNLKQAIAKGGGKLIRDNVREKRPYIFDAADIKDWKGTLAEFQRMGLIDDKQMLTDVGKKFFNSDPFTVMDEGELDPPAPTGRIREKHSAIAAAKLRGEAKMRFPTQAQIDAAMEDATQLAWGTGLIEKLNEFLRTSRLDGFEVDKVVIVDGKHLAIINTDIYTADAGAAHYDRFTRA